MRGPAPAVLLAGVLLASGCAPLPPVDGLASAAPELAARGRDPGDRQAVALLRAGLAGQELSSDVAIRIALLGNPGLQLTYAQLGFAAADVYEAARPRNPALSVAALSSDESADATQVGVGISLHLTDLLMLSARKRIAAAEYARVRQTIGAQALEVAADTGAAFLHMAGAAQMVAVREAIARAASTSAGLAQRVFDAGNISRLDLALEKAAAADSALALMQSRSELVRARAALNRLMGLPDGDDTWRVPSALPGLSDADAEADDLLALADRSRLDLAAARAEVQLRAEALGLTRRFRLLGEVDAGLGTERETDRSRITGPSLTLELPLFDRGAGRVARAQAQLQQSEARLAALELDISTGVREKAALLASARERALHYRDVLLPLREEVVGLLQRQVNFMLDDPSRLLLARQQEYEAYRGYLESLRDYGLARVELSRAVGTALPGETSTADAAVDPARLSAPLEAGDPQAMDHGAMHHEGMQEPAPDHPAGHHGGPS